MSETVRRFFSCLHAVALLCALSSTPLFAQDKAATPAPQEAARAAYGRGVEAYSAEKYQAAYEQFSLAEQAFPSPNIELMLGRSLSKLGRWLEAKTVLQRAQAGSNAPKYANTASLATAELTTVEKQLARIELDIGNAHGDESLSINGANVEPSTWGAPILLDPGAVKLEFSRPGVQAIVKQLELAPGALERVALSLPEPVAVAPQAVRAPAAATEPMTNPTDPIDTADRSRSPWLRGLSYALAGVGVAGFVGFAGFGAYSHGHYNKLEELCPPGKNCDSSYRWLATKGRTYQTLANVSLVAGSVALAAGVTLWVVSLSPGRAEVALTASGVRVAGSF